MTLGERAEQSRASMRHMLELGLLCFALAAVCGCSTNATLGGTPASEQASNASASGAQQSPARGNGFADATVDSQVLFEQDGLKVTLTGIDTAAGADVALLVNVENNSEAAVSVSPTFTAVNGYMVSATGIIEAKAGETIDGSFALVGDSLREYDISHVGTVQLCVGISGANISPVQMQGEQGDATGSKAIFASNPVTIATSLASQVDKPAAVEGDLIWHDGGLSVYQQRFVQDKEHNVAALVLWVVNESNEPAYFQYALSGVNGLSVEGYNSEQLAAGAQARTYIFVDDAMMRANLGSITVTGIDVSFTSTGFDGSEKAASELMHIDVR